LDASVIERLLKLFKGEQDDGEIVKLMSHLDYFKQFIEIQKNISVHSKEYAKLQDHCFNTIVKNVMPDDFRSSLYFTSKGDIYPLASNIMRYSKKSKFMQEEMFQKGEISEGNFIITQVEATKEQCETICELNKMLPGIHDSTKRIITQLGRECIS
jgi:hypothetical protein